MGVIALENTSEYLSFHRTRTTQKRHKESPEILIYQGNRGFHGGEEETRTPATVSRPTPLAEALKALINKRFQR